MSVTAKTLPATITSLILSMWLTGCSGPGGSSAVDEQAIADNNRAVGLMGKFEYENAQAAFAQLVEQYPGWHDAMLNKAIATLNRQQEGDEVKALNLASAVIADDASNLRAHYLAGLMQLYLGDLEASLNHFQTVAEGDESDAYAAYYTANCLSQLGRHEQAMPWYERAMQQDPYLRSAYYGAFQSLLKLGQRERAQTLAAEYQRLEKNPRSTLAEFKYTKMGPKAEAQAVDLADTDTPDEPDGPVFLDMQDVAIIGGAFEVADDNISFTTADIDADGAADLFLAGVEASAADGKRTPNLILRGGADGLYTLAADHPLAAVTEVNAVLWGDYDNDGLLDAYLCRDGANQLWRQVAEGEWQDVTASSGTAGGDSDTIDGAIFDADHDGDLDLYLVNADAPNELLNNNLDGSFRPLAQDYGIDGGSPDSIMVLPVDLDSDRDTDIIVLNASLPHSVYLNDRLWSYRIADGYEAFSNTAAVSLLAEDIDADGLIELYMLKADGEILRWQKDQDDKLVSQSFGAPVSLTTGQRPQLMSQDVDGDGVVDLIVATRDGWSALAFTADGLDVLQQVTATADTPQLTHLLLVGDSLRGPAMMAFTDKGLSTWQPGPGRYPFITLTVSGRLDTAQSMRSNADGIGTAVSVRTGSRWTRLQNFRNDSGNGQSLQAFTTGLGGAKRADFVALHWSDGVFQSELSLATGERHTIAETQRQLSSCPVLFAWNGEEFEFISDLLGVGGIGYATGPGTYATPRPHENFLFPEGAMQLVDDRYKLRIAEPMEEIAYLDAARLVHYDLPAGWHLVLDERMGISHPKPTGEPVFYRKEVLPTRASNDRGEEVLDRIVRVDGKAADIGELDRRFIGRTLSEHSIDIHFASSLDSHSGEPVLVIDGWVEYPYSQTNFAAWQAGATFDAPSLDASVDGETWQPVYEKFGYPAGMPRRMSLPLSSLPEGTTSLRLRSNLQVYWDRISVVYAEPLEEHRKITLPLAEAKLGKNGFAKRTTLAQYRPHYDYAAVQPFWDTRYTSGLYTRLGHVEELIAAADDAVAIIGPGEEVEFEFTASEPPPEGWNRVFVLETNGWAKDMDMFTRDGETVGPMPSTGHPVAARDALHARYNTRYLSGH